MLTMTVGMIVIAFLAALVVPTYIGRARITACEKSGGTWDHDRHACVRPAASRPAAANVP